MDWLERTLGGGLWGLVIVVGPIILLLVLAWAMMNNRRSRAEKDLTERSVRERREESRRADGSDRR
ncbi:hypothetical protein [Rhizorhabdus argentea]|uniref:hypothetical protein n=1 Tax=Rhizorhabdus argentea TaxID=1387174 RepID=UPI0030ED997D